MKTFKEVKLDDIFPYISGLINDGVDIVLTTTGCSMYPFFFDKKTKVTITKFLGNNLKKGDIVFYKRKNGQYVVHRAIRIKDKLVFNGDGQYDLEYGIEKKDIIGIVKNFTFKEKLIDVKNTGYKTISTLWRIVRPIRPILMRIMIKLNLVKG